MKKLLIALVAMTILYSCTKHDNISVPPVTPTTSNVTLSLSYANSVINGSNVDSSQVVYTNKATGNNYVQKGSVNSSSKTITAQYLSLPAGRYSVTFNVFQKDTVVDNSQFVFSIQDSLNTQNATSLSYSAPASLTASSKWNILRSTQNSGVRLSYPYNGSSPMFAIQAANADDIDNVQYTRTYTYFDGNNQPQKISKSVTLTQAQASAMTTNGIIVDSTDMKSLMSSVASTGWIAMNQSTQVNYKSHAAAGINSTNMANMANVPGGYGGQYSYLPIAENYGMVEPGQLYTLIGFVIYPDGSASLSGDPADEQSLLNNSDFNTWTLTGNTLVISCAQPVYFLFHAAQNVYLKATFNPTTGCLTNGTIYSDDNVVLGTFSAYQRVSF